MNTELARIVDALDETDAAAILLGLPYRSFCNGSDSLVEHGVWTDDGEVTDLGYDVRDALRLRHTARQRA